MGIFDKDVRYQYRGAISYITMPSADQADVQGGVGSPPTALSGKCPPEGLLNPTQRKGLAVRHEDERPLDEDDYFWGGL